MILRCRSTYMRSSQCDHPRVGRFELLPHRLARILGQLSSGGDTEPGIDRLCALCASVTAMSGASIMLMSDEMRGSVCSTDDVAHQIEELQYTLGEGPSVDAYRFEQPVIEPDLAHARAPRWPVFTPLALEAGARAVFGFPLLIGVVRLGALSLYRVAAGPLSDDQHADALVMADVAARAVLAMQANAPPGEIAVEFEARRQPPARSPPSIRNDRGSARRHDRGGPDPSPRPRLRREPSSHRDR